MNVLKNDRIRLTILSAVTIILFFWNIHAIPLTDGDSAFYAKIAKNIVDSGNWITMHYGDASSIIDKPPLVMWITAASFKAFGVNEFALNFWHSLCALLIVFFTYKLAKELFDKDIAFYSALVLATTAQFFYQSRSPLQDIPLTLFILLSVYSYLLFEKRSRIAFFYLSTVFVSLAVLTKGPVGLALPAITLFVYSLICRKKLPHFLHVFSAALLFLALVLPWFVAEYRIIGQRFLDVFIGHNLGRYLRPVDTIGNEASKYSAIKPQYDFYSFFLQTFILAIPWAGFVYPALFYNIKKRTGLLPVIFALSVILFFSLSLNYKISRYILPAFPALSIIIGKMISDAEADEDASRLFQWSSWITLIVILPVLLTATLLLYANNSNIGTYYVPLFLPFLIFMCFCLFSGSVLGILRRFSSSILFFASVSIMSYLVLISCLTAYYPKVNPISSFCTKINSMARPSDLVCQYKGTDAHFMIYYAKNDVSEVRQETKMRNLLLSKRRIYCISADKEATGKLKAALGRTMKVLDESANYTLFSN